MWGGAGGQEAQALQEVDVPGRTPRHIHLLQGASLLPPSAAALGRCCVLATLRALGTDLVAAGTWHCRWSASWHP